MAIAIEIVGAQSDLDFEIHATLIDGASELRTLKHAEIIPRLERVETKASRSP